ncbi:MAG TPA: lysophospholipid acyltransferase family protein [Chthonomonadaceae bacterium]|nr:lysophospholipid acyltransferase family protein [Chthonomonadaceae bacterium]
MTIPVPLPPETQRTGVRKRAERVAGRVAMWLFVRPMRALPLPAARAVGRLIGRLLYAVLGRYRRVAYKNLELIYPEQTATEREQMARSVFRHFGECGAEFLKLPQLSRGDVDALTTVEGEENLARALEGGRGAFIVTGHFGNWEFLARWLTIHEYKLNVVARDARDPAATKLMTEIRQGSGAQVLYRGNSARGVLQSLKRNEYVALLPDQNAADVFVPFLGVTTGTVDGPAILHLKTRAPLVFSWCWRTPDNSFHIVFEPPEVVEPTEDKAEDIRRVMTLINARLDAQIRRNPTQWLWLHDRWKASPGVFPDGERNARHLSTPAVRLRREAAELNDTAQR